ncbi:MAG: methyltransferase [Pseudomonadota bacterium]
MADVSPARIMQIASGHWPARTLQVAVKLGLFTVLSKGGMTAGQIRVALGLHPRAVPDFPDALVALKLLERDGEGAAAVYRNTAETATFVDRASPAYMGGIIEMSHDRLYPFWGDLIEALRTGEPQNELKRTGKSLFDQLYTDPARLEQFLAAMSGASTGNFIALAGRFDFSRYQALCDVGGAEGMLSMMVARAHPHLRCVSADLPVVEPIARRKIAALGFADRVATAAVDFLKDDLPRADVITMGMVLHDWNLAVKKMLVAKAYAALPPGGAFIVVEQLIDDARRENVLGLMMSLNMLVETGDGFDYTFRDFSGWCGEAGFSRCEVLPLAGTASAAIAYK